MKINTRQIGDVVSSIETIDRMFPPSKSGATNASKRTEAFLEKFNSAPVDDRMDVIRAARCLSSFCERLTRDVGCIDVRIEQSR